MAIPSSLFFSQNKSYGVGAITFDLIISETHNFNTAVSEHPIETGAVITDHIDNALEQGTVSGLISNHSLRSNGIISNRAQDAFDALVDLWKEKTIVTITTVMRTYENVVITSMPFQREHSTGDALFISLSFRKVEIVSLTEIAFELDVRPQDLESEQDRQIAPEAEIGETIPVTKIDRVSTGTVFRQGLTRTVGGL